jgi:eukaryotic-like serine/threonine-protein kinase
VPFDLSAERWRRLEELFQAAVDLSGPDRDSFIQRETSADPDLGRELRALIDHSAGAGQRIAGAVRRVAGRAAGDSSWVGRRFGPYRILREIGRGGMGVVFEAVRDDAEYDKRVALKVAPDWRDLEGLRERFRRERQILARIEHPNVARFLDGGTQDGIPWFAMEYIDGQPVTVWAREHRAGLRERLLLFRQVCAAVSHAHENLVIHRDLKPANILVSQAGTPKLLDFGIATLFDSVLETWSTTAGARLWTPDYTSPEQLRGGGVTVRTDVYSLGLILYELLCGARAQVADTSSPLALDRSICEAEPAPPSARAAAGGDRNLARQLRGDLDRIVAMATRKEPARRYASAAALDADIERFQAGRPVRARPSTPLYRLTKMVQRHWLATTAAALVAISVSGGVWSTLYEARRAERRFQELRGLANAFIFDVHDRIQYLPGSTQARKAIVAIALRYLEDLRRDAGSDPALVRDLAAAYEKIGDAQGNPNGSSLGDTRGALESYRRAESLLSPLAARGDDAAGLQLVSVVYDLGKLEQVLGDPRGLREFDRSRAMIRPLLAHQPRNIAALRLAANISADVARIRAGSREPQPAFDAAREAVGFAQRALDLAPAAENSRDYLAGAETGLGVAYLARGDPESAVRIYRAALTIRERLVKEHPDNSAYRRLLLLLYGHLGDALGPARISGLGRLPESVESFEKAAALAEQMSTRDPSDKTAAFDVAVAHMRTASSLLSEPGGAVRALPHLVREEVILIRLVKEDPKNQRYGLYALVLDCNMGKALAALGRAEEAKVRLRRARTEYREFAGGPNEKNARSWGAGATLALAEIDAGEANKASALALADDAAARFSRGALLGTAWNHAYFYRRLGLLYLRLGRKESAISWLRKSADIWRTMSVPGALEQRRRTELAAVERDLEPR